MLSSPETPAPVDSTLVLKNFDLSRMSLAGSPGYLVASSGQVAGAALRRPRPFQSEVDRPGTDP
jgi:hypothetical protein